MHFKPLVFFFWVFFVVGASAQPPHSFTRYGRENGFAGTTVEDLSQDSHGQLWLATWTGLYRFDGRTFQNFRTELPDGQDNPQGNRFTDVEILPDGEIQAVSYDHRLLRFNPDTRSLESVDSRGHAIQQILRPTPRDCYYLTPENEVLDAGFSHYCRINGSAVVHTMAASPEGEVWILTDRGIYRDGTLASEVPTFCAEIIDEALYIGSAAGEVLRYEDRQLTTLPTQLPSDITFIAKVPSRPEMLIGTDRDGLEVHNLEDDSHRHIPLSSESDEEGSFTCRTDVRGNLWIYSTLGSLYWYDPEHYRLVPFLNKNMQQGWNSETGITAFFADRQGNLWIGSTWGGLERVVFREDHFKLRAFDGSGQITPENSVRAIYETENGWIYAATRDSRLHLFDQDFREWASWPTGHPGYTVTGSHDGRIWVGTKGSGLYEMAPQSSDVIQFTRTAYPKDDLFYGPNSQDIYALLEGPDHRLWIGSFDEGVSYVSLEDNSRLFISKKNRLSFPTERRNRIRCLAFGPDGRLYAGGQMGLFVCDHPDGEPEEMHFERFSQIPDYDVQHILFTRQGRLYISSFGAGLLIFDTADPDSGFESLTTDNGMLSNYILSTIEDNAGNLWIASQGGLNRLNLQTGSLIAFPYDRINLPMRFNEGQPLYARNGNLYFNSTGGIFYFDPQEISNSNFVPELVIQAFYVSGQRQNPEGTVRMSPSDIIRTQFAAVDLTAPEQILYVYRLDGRDRDWIPLGSQNTLALSGLKPGKYTLRLRSTNGDGLDVDNELAIPLLVRKAFLESFWPALLLFLAATGITFLLMRPRRKAPVREDPVKDNPLLTGLHGEDLRFAQAFLEFVDGHLDDGALDVGQMCAGMNVSRSVLFERCRTLLNATPASFLRKRRMDKAKALIREGGHNVTEISYAVGFNDPHYFSKAFKQETGMTPTEYRDGATT